MRAVPLTGDAFLNPGSTNSRARLIRPPMQLLCITAC
jgi:hypothetical protein